MPSSQYQMMMKKFSRCSQPLKRRIGMFFKSWQEELPTFTRSFLRINVLGLKRELLAVKRPSKYAKWDLDIS
jgi:hypothetical protein